jgi:hypothetical protein
MTRLAMSHTKAALFVLGVFCLCAPAGLAQPASSNRFEGGLAAYPIDGVYRGHSQPVVATDASCRAGQDVAFEVRHGRFKLPWNNRQVFDARISTDGSFFATAGLSPVRAEKYLAIVPELRGRITPAGLVADYGTRWCRYRLQASQSAAVEHLSQGGNGGVTRR